MAAAPQFDLTDLQLIVNIGDLGNLTRGAEKSNLSAPAASARVRHLEDCLQTQLLSRTNQGVELTAAGQALVRHARAILARAELLTLDMRHYELGAKGRVRLMGNTTAMAEVLPAVLGRFLSTYSDVEIEVRERLSHQIVKAVADGTADVGIVGGCPEVDGLHFLPCRDDNLVLVVPKGHPLSSRRSVAFSDTLDYSFVGLSEASAIHAYLIQTAAAIGRQPLKFRAEVSNFDVVCRMVEANVGIGVVTRSVAIRCAKVMDIRVIQMTDSWTTRKLHICFRSFDELPPYTRELIRMFVEEAAIDSAPGAGPDEPAAIIPTRGPSARQAGSSSSRPGRGTARPGS